METSFNLEFETRTCENEGCPKTFKVLATSKQRVCALNCSHGPGITAMDFVKRPKEKRTPQNLEIIKKKDSEKQPEQVAKTEAPSRDVKREWEQAVQEARTIFKYMSTGRMEIATKAIYACDINHGGGDHWNGFEDVYTLTKFAEDIGIHYKTLHQWVRIKRNIYDKVGTHWNSRNFMVAIRADTRVQPEMTKKEVIEIYLDEASRTKDSTRFRTMCKNLNTIITLDKRGKSIFDGVDEEQLHTCLAALDKVKKIVKERMKEI